MAESPRPPSPRSWPAARRRLGSERVATATVGAMLRDWREDRRRSQMDLALDVGVSTRHLSFVETGKSKPSPELVLALAEHLDVPLRERNTMLLAAGYAPRYPQTPLDDDAMASVRQALAELIRAHDPYPAVVVDRGVGRRDGQHRARRRSSTASPTTCSSRRSTRTASRCTPRAWRRASRTSPSGPTTSSARSTARSRSPATPACGDLLDEVLGVPERRRARRRRGGRATASPTVVVPLRLRVGDGDDRAVVVLDEHVDRHARRHHARRAARRAVPPRRRGDRGDGRRARPDGVASLTTSAAMDLDHAGPPPTRRRRRSSPPSRRCGRGRSSAGGDDARRPSVWRFSGRWWSQPIPLRRARPWI